MDLFPEGRLMEEFEEPAHRGLTTKCTVSSFAIAVMLPLGKLHLQITSAEI